MPEKMGQVAEQPAFMLFLILILLALSFFWWF